MENCVYLGVRLGDVPFSRVCLKRVNMQSSLADSMTENSYSLGENEKFGKSWIVITLGHSRLIADKWTLNRYLFKIHCL